jgi:septum formation protein
MRLVLASASPRRAELLTAAGFTFDVLPVDVDERVRPDERPADYVRRLASEKSASALERVPGSAAAVIVLGADTVVVVDDHVLGKPRDADDAADMMRRLSGRSHQVMTGVSVRTAANELIGVDSSSVTFAPLTPAEIDWYVATGEGRDKAGAYAIQGLAGRFIPRVEGSYSNVVGLPIALIYGLLQKASPNGIGALR